MSALALRPSDQVAFDFSTDPQAAMQLRAHPLGGPVPDGRPQELPLRSLARCHTSRFTAWRGRSGRRYVASSFAIADHDALSFSDAVLIAVSRDRSIISVREAGPWGLEPAVARWRDEVQGAGAHEIHVHLIAATADDRRKAVADLTPVH